MKKTLLLAIAVASIATVAAAAGKPSDKARPGTDGTDNPGAIVGGVCRGPAC